MNLISSFLQISNFKMLNTSNLIMKTKKRNRFQKMRNGFVKAQAQFRMNQERKKYSLVCQHSYYHFNYSFL
jgi:hypothetical protein